MAKSTVWLNMNENNRLIVAGDAKPWGGGAYTGFLNNIRVENVTISPGASFDSATLVYTNKQFGEEVDYFQPIRIMAVEGEGLEAKFNTIFRGFIVKNNSTLDSSTENVKVECLDYKWYLSKRSFIRGQWYALEGATNSPTALGTGNTIGGQKFVFERYRAALQGDGGYLQSHDCVFNKNGIPDCFTNSYASNLCVFFKPKTNYYTDDNGDIAPWDETKGLRNNYWESLAWGGKYWTWATILSHIETYWINPYSGIQAGIEIHKGDLAKIADIQNDQPVDFSIEGMNPVTAIDNVVSNLPGRWVWYLDYSMAQVKIRIKEFKDLNSQNVFLKVSETEQKVAISGANIVSAQLTRDGTDGVKHAIARGRNLKLVCTVKLVPLWKKYNNGTRDFESQEDFVKWRNFVSEKYFDQGDSVDTSSDTYSKEEIERYRKIYRHYGVAIEGNLFGRRIVHDKLEYVDQPISLEGNLSSEYGTFETDLKKFFFENARIIRDVEAPSFARYEKDVVVFAWDELRDGRIFDKDGAELKHKDKKVTTDSDATNTSKRKKNNLRWVTTEDSEFEYDFDEKTGILVFNTPQFAREFDVNSGGTKKDSAQEANLFLSKCRFSVSVGATGQPIVASREIYLTATFITDVAAILGRDVTNSLVDNYSGAPFVKFIDRNDSDIVIHKNAWYPITDKNKPSETVSYSENTMDNHVIGEKIVKCTSFDNYKQVVGEGADELLRDLISFIEAYNRRQDTLAVVMPYLETGYLIGDKLKKIHGTKLTDLNAMLTQITWSADADSDYFTTSLTFNNFHSKNKSSTGYVHKKGDNIQDADPRESYTYEEKDAMKREPRETIEEEPDEDGSSV